MNAEQVITLAENLTTVMKPEELFNALIHSAKEVNSLAEQLNKAGEADINEWNRDKNEAQWLSLKYPDILSVNPSLYQKEFHTMELWEVGYLLSDLFQKSTQNCSPNTGLVAYRDGEAIDFCICGRLTLDNFQTLFGQTGEDSAQRTRM